MSIPLGIMLQLSLKHLPWAARWLSGKRAYLQVCLPTLDPRIHKWQESMCESGPLISKCAPQCMNPYSYIPISKTLAVGFRSTSVYSVTESRSCWLLCSDPFRSSS